jgi:Domain of unknown function (DUF3362)
MGRADLIGPGKHHLVPAAQPTASGTRGRAMPVPRSNGRPQKFLTKGISPR